MFLLGGCQWRRSQALLPASPDFSIRDARTHVIGIGDKGAKRRPARPHPKKNKDDGDNFHLLPNVQDEPLGPEGRVGSGGWLGSFFIRTSLCRALDKLSLDVRPTLEPEFGNH